MKFTLSLQIYAIYIRIVQNVTNFFCKKIIFQSTDPENVKKVTRNTIFFI